MNIQKHYISQNIFSRPGKPLAKVKGLVIHWVANPGSSAMANRDYFESLAKQSPQDTAARYASAQYIVGLEGEVVQCMTEFEVAYHTGAREYTPGALSALGPYPNNCTIGIELCHPDASGAFTRKTLDAAIELAAGLCYDFALRPEQDIWTHHQVTGKYCPKWFVEYPQAFTDFKHAVYEKRTRG